MPQNAANDADAEGGNANLVRLLGLRSSRGPSAGDFSVPRSRPITRRHATSAAIQISLDTKVTLRDPPSARDASGSDGPASFASVSENQEGGGGVKKKGSPSYHGVSV